MKANFDVCINDPSQEDVLQVEDIESSVCSVTFAAIDDYGDDMGVLSPDLIRVTGRADETYHMLIKAVEDGFPSTHHQTAPKIREYWKGFGVVGLANRDSSFMLQEGSGLFTFCSSRSD